MNTLRSGALALPLLLLSLGASGCTEGLMIMRGTRWVCRAWDDIAAQIEDKIQNAPTPASDAGAGPDAGPDAGTR